MAITMLVIAIVVVGAKLWYDSRREYLRWLAHDRAKLRWQQLNSTTKSEEH